MEYRKFGNAYVLRLERGEEVVSSLTQFCKEEKILLGKIEGLGACDHLTVGLYDVDEQVYHKKSFDQPFEITSLIGNISNMDGEVYLHIHINVADSQLKCFGGHLNECVISATCELYVTVYEGNVGRKKDPATGLNLYDFH